jgi:uncharacterized coiled-coil DUF342 family protein
LIFIHLLNLIILTYKMFSIRQSELEVFIKENEQKLKQIFEKFQEFNEYVTWEEFCVFVYRRTH